jgi:hypothetical protein
MVGGFPKGGSIQGQPVRSVYSADTPANSIRVFVHRNGAFGIGHAEYRSLSGTLP